MSATLIQVWVAPLIIALSLFTSCVEDRSAECKAFQEMPLRQRLAESLNLPTEKQLDLYLCAMKQEPPDLELGYVIARKGESAIPPVLERLKTSEDELDQRNMILIFEVMSQKGHLRGRTDVVSAISNVVEKMKPSPTKTKSSEFLDKIRNNGGI